MYAIANIRLTEVPAAADPTPCSRRVSGNGWEVNFSLRLGLLVIFLSKTS